jgi:hypothetical protein
MEHQQAVQLLQEHFKYQYSRILSSKLAPSAKMEEKDGVLTVITGVPYAFLNTVSGYPKDNHETFIADKKTEFKNLGLPFAWFIDENHGADFKQKLLRLGFQDAGVFQGVIGKLDKKLEPAVLNSEYQIEQLTSPEGINDFNEFVCCHFGLQSPAKEMYGKILYNEASGTNATMAHWCIRRDKEIVSGVSTLIQGDMVSFWNGATAVPLRRSGLSTALRKAALAAAIDKGCSVGASYLMSEGLALGICRKLGYEPRWRFNVYAAS